MQNQPELTAQERQLLIAGLEHWGGPARPTPAFVVAMGFSGLGSFARELSELTSRISAGHDLSGADWTRALVATEVGFASDVVGAGVEWEVVSGTTDFETIQVLRGLQRKLIHFCDRSTLGE